MSRVDNEDPERANVAVVAPHSHPPVMIQSSQDSNFGDSSGPLFSLYSKVSEEEDIKMAEGWQKDAGEIMIFTGFFSVVVAILVVLSVQDLRPKSEDASAFYLQSIYQIFADPSLPRPSIPSPPAFSPPRYAVWVNSLWFLSLVMNLSCAMVATLLRLWARRYLRLTQLPRCSPDKQARVRAFISNGVNKFHVAMAVEVLTATVHLSLFIFFAGLLTYLFNINNTVFSPLVCYTAISEAIYVCITLMIVFRLDSPYVAPFSAISWLLCTSALFLVFRVLASFRRQFSHEKRERFVFLMLQYRKRLTLGGIRKAIEEAASKWTSESEFDVRVLESTLDGLRDDDALEKFTEALPGFYQSDMIKDLQQRLPEEVRLKILHTLVGFSRRTLSYNELSVSAKIRRLAICFEAAGQVQASSGIRLILDNMIHVNWRRAPHSVEIGHFLRSWDESNNGQFASYIQVIVGSIIASTRDQDGRWITLAMDHLGVSEHVLRDYLVHGNSVLLANLVHITRLLSRSDLSDWVLIGALQSLSEFDVHNVLPGLQHDFCALWNELAQRAQNNGELGGPRDILTNIRPIYTALHPDDWALTHSLCHDPSHYPGSTPQANDAPMEAAQPPVATFITSPHRDSTLVAPTPFLPAPHPDDTTPSGEATGDLHSPFIVVTDPMAQVPQSHHVDPFSSATPSMSHR